MQTVLFVGKKNSKTCDIWSAIPVSYLVGLAPLISWKGVLTPKQTHDSLVYIAI